MVITVSSHIDALNAVVAHARQSDDWIVVVAPDGKDAENLQKALTVVRAAGASMGGRTLMFPSGGRVTVARASQTVAGSGFHVMFLGFDSELSPRDVIALQSWRQQSAGSAALSERPGEIRIIAA
jgi:hypothetical protein